MRQARAIAVCAVGVATTAASASGGTLTARLDRHDRAVVVAVERHRQQLRRFDSVFGTTGVQVRTAVDRCPGSSKSAGEVTLAVSLLNGSYRIRTTFHSVRTFIGAQRADDPVLRRWLGLLAATSALAERSGFTSHPVALTRVCGLVREVEKRRRAGKLATGRVGDETLALAGVDVAMLNRGSAPTVKLERMRKVLEPRFRSAGLSADSAQHLVTFN